MPASNLDIARTAHLWIQRHGDAATAKAREMVEKMRRRGDAEGSDVSPRTIVATVAWAGRRQRPGIGAARVLFRRAMKCAYCFRDAQPDQSCVVLVVTCQLHRPLARMQCGGRTVPLDHIFGCPQNIGIAGVVL